MSPLDQTILQHHDAKKTVAEICGIKDVGFGYVYSVLRKHRPDRKRQPRKRTSEKRKFILGLLTNGIKPPRAAFLASCSAAYVYKLMSEEGIAA